MKYKIYLANGSEEVIDAHYVLWDNTNKTVEFNTEDDRYVAVFNTGSIIGFKRLNNEPIEAVKGIEYTGVVDLGIEEPEENCRCGKCKHYVVTDSRSNWNGEPPTKIYVCDLVGHDCYFEPKEDEENG